MTAPSSVQSALSEQQTDRLSWGVVELQVTNLERAVDFWTTSLGLIERSRTAEVATLGTAEKTLVVLTAGATRPVAPAHTGMYHVALGVPGQAEFSRILARLMHLNVPVGPTDHLISKSIYLSDPDGLEIEVVLETPERLGRVGGPGSGLMLYDRDGRPHNGRAPLNVAAELSQAKGANLMAPLDDKAFVAHLHLKVAGLEPALSWFETIGFARNMTLHDWGFADMSAGGVVKHRLAMNIWAGANRPPAPENMARLVRYDLIVHDNELLAQAPLEARDGVFYGRDPAGIEVALHPVALPHTSGLSNASTGTDGLILT